MSKRLVLSAAIAAMGLPLLSPSFGQPALELDGSYEVVGFRAASNVATTRAMQEANWRQELIGVALDFGSFQAWFDGSICLAGRVAASDQASIWLEEPNLSDLQVAPGPEDHRTNIHAMVDCGARPASSIKPLLIVDGRVLVTTSDDGATYFILEKPLSSEVALAFERELLDQGFNPGSVDGVVDEATRMAVAELAQSLGAEFRFQRGVITDNILDFVLR